MNIEWKKWQRMLKNLQELAFSMIKFIILIHANAKLDWKMPLS